jgi:hypothetical protein
VINSHARSLELGTCFLGTQGPRAQTRDIVIRGRGEGSLAREVLGSKRGTLHLPNWLNKAIASGAQTHYYSQQAARHYVATNALQ